MNIPASINFRFRHLLTLLGLAAVLGAAPAAAQTQSLDQVVAVVEDGVILESELNARINQVRQQSGSLPAGMNQAELRSQVLEQLILERLQLQRASQAGIRIDDNMLNQTLTDIAQRNNMSFDQFRQALESQGQYVATREQIRRDMMINQVQNAVVNQRISITRQEVENYLRSEAAQANIAPEYRVAHILLPNDSTAQSDRLGEIADVAYNRLREGDDIQQMASSGQFMGTNISGGDLGWRRPESLPTIFRDVVPELSVGEVSEPFTSDSGYHIVKLMETRGGAELQIEEARVRHIMLQPNEIRSEEQALEQIRQLRQRILSGEDFGDIARQNTDDPNTMVSGGDMGWVSRGQVPPAFMNAIEATDTGELSEPFQVDSAWHIAEVLDRRTRDVTEENKRFRAEQVLRDRKFENELQNWLTELRDTAYVDIKGSSDS